MALEATVSVLVILICEYRVCASIPGNKLLRGIRSKRYHTPLAFFTWPDSFKLGAKKACSMDEQSEIKLDSFGGEVRLRGGSTAESIPGPTTKPLTQKSNAQGAFHGEQIQQTENGSMVKCAPGSPLSELISMLQAQESALMMQASQCRAAAQRLVFIQQLLYSKVYSKGGEPKNQVELEDEVVRWKVCTFEMHRHLNKCFLSAGKSFADLLGESKISLPEISPAKSAELQGLLDSAVTPDHHSEEDEDLKIAKGRKSVILPPDGPTIRAIDRKRALETQVFFFVPVLHVGGNQLKFLLCGRFFLLRQSMRSFASRLGMDLPCMGLYRMHPILFMVSMCVKEFQNRFLRTLNYFVFRRVPWRYRTSSCMGYRSIQARWGRN